MEPFLARFLAEVDDNLGDPHSQRRLPPAKRLRDLYQIQRNVFERLLNLTGVESSIGRTETTFDLVANQDHYLWPQGFRQFMRLEQRMTGFPDQVTYRLWSIDPYHPGPGVEVLDAERG